MNKESLIGLVWKISVRITDSIPGWNLTEFAQGPEGPKATNSWGPSQLYGARVIYTMYNFREIRGAFRAPSSENLGVSSRNRRAPGPRQFPPLLYIRFLCPYAHLMRWLSALFSKK